MLALAIIARKHTRTHEHTKTCLYNPVNGLCVIVVQDDLKIVTFEVHDEESCFDIHIYKFVIMDKIWK